MRTKLFVVVALLTPILTNCQSTIQGTVTDPEDGQAYPYIFIELVETEFNAITDHQGQFKIDSIPSGQYSLKVISSMHQDLKLDSLDLSNDTNIYLNINYPPPCEFTSKKKACPLCHKRDMVIPILYGLPSPGGIEAAENGELWLGGCVISGCDPFWHCVRDGTEF